MNKINRNNLKYATKYNYNKENTKDVIFKKNQKEKTSTAFQGFWLFSV